MSYFTELQNRLKGAFAEVVKRHAESGLPVVWAENKRVYYLYPDGTKIDITDTTEDERDRITSENSHRTIYMKK